MKLLSKRKIVIFVAAIVAFGLIVFAAILFMVMRHKPEIKVAMESDVMTPAQSTNGFSEQAVIDYCRKYAGKGQYNKQQYPTWQGKDCTNFTSQVLHNAGWEFTGQYKDDQYSWYCESVKTSAGYETRWSTTWINTNQWHIFAITTGRGVDTTDWDGLRIGDVIQVDMNNDHILDHSMIVTTAANGDYKNVRISDHSLYNYDYPLVKVLKKMPKDGTNAHWYALTLTH